MFALKVESIYGPNKPRVGYRRLRALRRRRSPLVNAKYSSAILPPPRARASAAADGGSVPGETTVIYVRRHRRQTELEAEFDAILSDRSVPFARGTASRRTYMRHMYARRYLFPQFI